MRHAVAVAVLDRRQELLRARGAEGAGESAPAAVGGVLQWLWQCWTADGQCCLWRVGTRGVEPGFQQQQQQAGTCRHVSVEHSQGAGAPISD